MIHSLLSRIGVETWKDIPDFDNYQASNLGNFRSLKFNKIKLLSKSINGESRYVINTYNKKKKKTFKAAVLVAMAFLNHKPCGHKIVVDHIDNNALNDKLYNLQLITHRQNCSKDKKGTSKYTGVIWDKRINKWKANIRIKQKLKYLGTFKNEIKAANAYKKALKEYERGK
jgi:hypothetical protein